SAPAPTAGGPPPPAPSPAPTPTPSPSPSPSPPPPAPAPAPPPAGAAMLGTCPAFPATAIFNTRIDDPVRFPPHASSTTWINAIGSTRALHADWGTTEDASSASYYGIPMNLLSATAPETDWPAITFTADGAPDESDCAIANGSGGHDATPNCLSQPTSTWRFPFPRDAVVKIEGHDCPGDTCDRHVLVVEQGTCR